MRCQKVRSFLSAYCKNELHGRRQKAVKAHLEVCPECRREEALALKVEGSLGKIPYPTLSDDFNTKVLNRIAGERFKETRSKAYHPKNAPVFGWGKVVPALSTMCLVLVFVFSGGLDILNKKSEPISIVDQKEAWETAQPTTNPVLNASIEKQRRNDSIDRAKANSTFASHAKAGWDFEKELARVTRIKSLMYSLSNQNGFNNRLASILVNPEGQSILMRRPFGQSSFGTYSNTTSVNAVGR